MSEPLILLVGANPLPNYLAARMLDWGRLILFYTRDTEPVKDRLVKALEASHSGFDREERFIAEATGAESVRNAFETLPAIPGTAYLHYSGGTKPMAVHVYRAWLKAGGEASRACYVDDNQQLLRFDDGRYRNLQVDLDLHTLVTLHGLESLRDETDSPTAPTSGDATAMARVLIPHPESRKLVSQQVEKRFKTEGFQPQAIATNLKLSQDSIPQPEWSTEQRAEWAEFLSGKWLERWVESLILTTGLIPVERIYRNIDAELKGRQFEVDLVAIRGHCLYLLSCFTGERAGRCKSKLFEVALRAQQMGGDLARSALVSFLEGDDGQGDRVEQVQSDVATVWGSPNTPKVFGRKHLREWLGPGGAEPRLHGLESWLRS